jgi:hypothetical protein
MKPIDIEQLARKNSGEIPNGFFEEMQQNVLQQTVNKEKIIAKSLFATTRFWSYSIAAAVVLLASLVIIIPSNNPGNHSVTITDNVKPTENQAPQSVKTVEIPRRENNILPATQEIIVQPKEVEAVNKPTNEVSNEPVDFVLSGMSRDELAEMSNRAEQDIYLDLYN